MFIQNYVMSFIWWKELRIGILIHNKFCQIIYPKWKILLHLMVSRWFTLENMRRKKVVEDRKGLFQLFQSICHVAPYVTQIFVKNTLDAIIGISQTSFEDIEPSTSLFIPLVKERMKKWKKTIISLLGR